MNIIDVKIPMVFTETSSVLFYEISVCVGGKFDLVYERKLKRDFIVPASEKNMLECNSDITII